MKENLPVYIEPATGEAPPGAFELLPVVKDRALPRAAEGDVFVDRALPPELPLDRYGSVCMHMRETRIVASKDPGAFNWSAFAAQAAKPANSAWQGRARKQLPIGQAAAWICVLQLGAIIWILTGGPLHVEAFDRLRNSLWLMAQPTLACLTHNGIIQLVPDHGAAPSSAFTSGKSFAKRLKHKSKHALRVAGCKRCDLWPLQASFVPPPPADMPQAGLMVPPPPVAYSLWQKGAGAAGASTLPVHAGHPLSAAAVPSASAVVKHESAGVDAKPAKLAACADSQAAAVPGKGQPYMPPALDAAPLNSPAELPAVASRLTAPLPSQAVPPLAAPSPCYTVITGNRKRLITDR